MWSSIEDVAGPQLRTKIGVIEVKAVYTPKGTGTGVILSQLN